MRRDILFLNDAGPRGVIDIMVATRRSTHRPRSARIPIMIGGSGEKKTLRLVAQYADESNLTCGPLDEVPRKLDALAAHCQRLGRDRSEITVSLQARACVATDEQALAELDAALAERGMDPKAMGEDDAAAIRGLIPHGDPDEIGELFATYLVDGIDGLTVSAIANGHLEGRVALLGETLGAAGALTPGGLSARWMKRMASKRVAVLSRNRPRTAEVTVDEPGLRTPRIDMHRCSASITTSTPRGSRVRSMRVGDLGGEALLDLGAPGVAVDQAGQLGQAGDPAVVVGDVGHVGLAR